MYEESFTRRAYLQGGVQFPLTNTPSSAEPAVVVDAGAKIGLFSLHILARAPRATAARPTASFERSAASFYFGEGAGARLVYANAPVLASYWKFAVRAARALSRAAPGGRSPRHRAFFSRRS